MAIKAVVFVMSYRGGRHQNEVQEKARQDRKERVLLLDLDLLLLFYWMGTRMAVLPAVPFPLSSGPFRVGPPHVQFLVDSQWPSPRSLFLQ